MERAQMCAVAVLLLPLLLGAGALTVNDDVTSHDAQAQGAPNTTGAILAPSPPSALAPAPAPGTDGTGRLPRVIILHTNQNGQVFSGTFNGQETTKPNATTQTPPALQLEYTAPYSNLQVYTLNETVLNTDVGVQSEGGFDDVTAGDQETAKIAAFCRQLLVQNPDLQICEPDRLAVLDGPAHRPNDPLLPQQWALQQIQIQKAWNAGAYGGNGVRVCMVDTGLDYFHPDLASNLWKNTLEIPNNGIDDDNNGVVDDVFGANFVQGGNSGDPYDDNGHGTFVAGVVGAVGNNKVGIDGVSQVASIIACKFMDASGNGWISDAIRCYDYCTQQDAHIISNSWGVYAASAAMQAAAQALNARGVLMTASAGNNGLNTDSNPHPPSTLTTPNVIAVAATNSDGTLWSGSNYGLVSVDVAAPGVGVLGLAIGGSYIQMTGTSMATPHVTGVAAIVLGKFVQKGFTITTRYPSVGLAAQVVNSIVQSTMSTPGAKKIMYGTLNATGAVYLVPARAPVKAPVSSGTTTIGGPKSPATSVEGIVVGPGGPLASIGAPGSAPLAVADSASGPSPAGLCACATAPAASPGMQTGAAPADTLAGGDRTVLPGGGIAAAPAAAAPAGMVGRKMMASRQ